ACPLQVRPRHRTSPRCGWVRPRQTSTKPIVSPSLSISTSASSRWLSSKSSATAGAAPRRAASETPCSESAEVCGKVISHRQVEQAVDDQYGERGADEAAWHELLELDALVRTCQRGGNTDQRDGRPDHQALCRRH